MHCRKTLYRPLAYLFLGLFSLGMVSCSSEKQQAEEKPQQTEPVAEVPVPTPAEKPKMAESKGPTLGLSLNEDGTYNYSYFLPFNSSSLYPSWTWLPTYYKQYYPNLVATITEYTQQSLDRGGVNARVSSVYYINELMGIITLTGNDQNALRNFAEVQTAFLKVSTEGLNGVNKCKGVEGCWDPHPGAEPWAFFLPLGLPMINQVAVTYLNYPPDDSLVDHDYLKNFTMDRWAAVLKTVSIENPYLYETIVDARPIAAPGSGQANYMPDITTYFNSEGNNYDTPMLQVLTDPPTNASAATLPVIVLGTPSRDAWAKIIGVEKVNILEVGTTKVLNPNKQTAWVASNHPDVTSYQCCPGDPDPNCGGSYDLVPDEKIDLQAACIIKALSETPTADPNVIKAACAEAWDLNPSPANLQAICVRAKLDYDFTTSGQCKSQTAAEAFCSYYQNNACPTNVYTCDVPKE